MLAGVRGVQKAKKEGGRVTGKNRNTEYWDTRPQIAMCMALEIIYKAQLEALENENCAKKRRNRDGKSGKA